MGDSLPIPPCDVFLSPKRPIERLELKNGSHILNVGPGPGYSGVPIAEMPTNEVEESALEAGFGFAKAYGKEWNDKNNFRKNDE